jgi:hypothetical protein
MKTLMVAQVGLLVWQDVTRKRALSVFLFSYEIIYPRIIPLDLIPRSCYEIKDMVENFHLCLDSTFILTG